MGVKVREIKDRESVNVTREDLKILIEELKALKVGIEEVNGVDLETEVDKGGEIWGCSSSSQTTSAPNYTLHSKNSQITMYFGKFLTKFT